MGIEEESFFQRQIQVPEIGSAGQKKWKNSSVLIIGLGGLGCPAALQLALGGIGRIGLIDFDRVEVSNLHRQTLFTFKDVGLPKTEVVSKVLLEHCPWLQVECFFELISESTIPERFDGWDLVLDCTDTISSKYLINDLCVSKSIPLVTASVFRTSAQFAIFSGKGQPCYRCLFPNLEEGDTMNCSVGGVLGVQTALAGTYQSSLALQYLLDPKATDLSSIYFLEWNPPLLYPSKVDLLPDCPVCGHGKKETNKSRDEKEIETIAFVDLQKKGKTLLIDVRENDETKSHPIPDTILIPLSQLEQGYLPELPEDTTVVFICETGIRSKKALSYFRNINEIYSLLGGRRAYLSFLQNKNSH
ncbi:HesA/MoeB/ThiF family protein [Leptospira kanakyensis]|uniref:Dinucleotide-utilizing protein n=1 Tax=Leptospira kanakyensis TaxID=2484968 RepID=A0A6N4QQK2_9LEPT|nr:HesA/MoeB/ThiF family protein [Leptospira kanakyensis]MCW7482835.1 HesA/MoeB/ThiF family protein [Leptospira kanakyensis]TGK55528.1 dinucleotide-utilizing protein [Leptospira kanakyensis]TGK61064.1 dinucleotide-utilizing protein [Leptospira kanakyensis]TGK76464.1 dinucleotide-utilizing protein [Leptospira kanakyensis]